MVVPPGTHVVDRLRQANESILELPRACAFRESRQLATLPTKKPPTRRQGFLKARTRCLSVASPPLFAWLAPGQDLIHPALAHHCPNVSTFKRLRRPSARPPGAHDLGRSARQSCHFIAMRIHTPAGDRHIRGSWPSSSPVIAPLVCRRSSRVSPFGRPDVSPARCHASRSHGELPNTGV
jgi:hypothetical protein